MTEARRFLLCFGALHAGLLVISVAGWQRPEFRAWEVLKDPDTPYFFPGRRVEMTEVGDLGFRCWVRALQRARPGLMSTDERGFRNPPGLPPPRVVVVGDSYVAGASLRDEETLPVRLAARLGVPVQGVACETAMSPTLYLAEPRFLGPGAPDVVVYAPSSRLLVPIPADIEAFGGAVLDRALLVTRPPQGAMARLAAAGAAVRERCETLARDNGLAREARFVLNGAVYRLRGRSGRAEVIHPDGEPALALPLAEQLALLSPAERRVEAVAAGVAAFARTARARGARFVFAPVPDSYEVYPDLFPAAELAACPRPTMREATLERLRGAGVEVVDLGAALRADRTPYVYQRDDSHWSPRGVELAAAALEGPVRAGLR